VCGTTFAQLILIFGLTRGMRAVKIEHKSVCTQALIYTNLSTQTLVHFMVFVYIFHPKTFNCTYQTDPPDNTKPVCESALEEKNNKKQTTYTNLSVLFYIVCLHSPFQNIPNGSAG
jgi:hypothetical protein